MTTQLPALAESYIQATNNHDNTAFLRLFAGDCVVDDNGRVLRGLEAIRAWSDKEIFAAQVTLEVLEAVVNDDESVITTKVDGTFDRTGLPDPVIIRHQIVARDGKIAALTCRLAASR